MGENRGLTSLFKKYSYYILLVLVITLSYMVFEFAYLFQDSFSKLMSIGTYLTWHNIFEFSGVLICFAVFVVSYYTYEQTRRLRFVFLGSVFLLMGIIDSFHTLSYKGMPEFFIQNDSANRATTFWITSRVFGGMGFLAASFIPANRKSSLNKRIFAIPSVILSFLVFVAATYFPEVMPAMYIEGQGLTREKIIMEYTVIFFLAVSAARLIMEHIRTRDGLIMLFSGALVFNMFSELAFVSYNSVYDIYNYLGHVYKFIAFFIVFRVMFIYNVQKPYIELSKAKNELKEYAENLDRIVDVRTQQLKEINQRLLEDLEYARDIQNAMLPSILPTEEEVVFKAKYFPAERVSGDFYNVFKLDDSNIAMYIGDVSGHGVPAAMLTVFMNQNIKAITGINEDTPDIMSPSIVLQKIYESFNRTNFKEDIYAVMFYAVYNMKNKKFTYSSAGMNAQPLIVSSSGKVSYIEISGFPICKFIEYHMPHYNTATIELNSGDKVLFYTDGLIDAENRYRYPFSEERLINLLQKGIGQNCSQLSQTIENEVFNFIDENPSKDDITYFIMEVV